MSKKRSIDDFLNGDPPDRLDFDRITGKRAHLGRGEDSDSDSEGGFEVDTDPDTDSDEDDEEKKKVEKLQVSKRNSAYFDRNDPKAGQLYVFIGKSEKGKTHFMRWLLMEKMTDPVAPYKFGIAFVKTKYKNSYDFLPEHAVFEGWNPEVFFAYVDNLQKMFEQNDGLPPSFIVLEDLMGVLENETSEFTNFIATFRHLSIDLYVASQSLVGHRAISTAMRAQTNFAVMFNEKRVDSVENLWRNYGAMFEKKDFIKYFDLNTNSKYVGPYVAIVYKEREDDVDENYILMRAPAKLPKMRLKMKEFTDRSDKKDLVRPDIYTKRGAPLKEIFGQ